MLIDRASVAYDSPAADAEPSDHANMENLLERLIELQASSPTFRIAFRSKCLTSFIALTKMFVPRASQISQFSDGLSIRLSDKLLHLTMMLTLDDAIPKSQIQEVQPQSTAPLLGELTQSSSQLQELAYTSADTPPVTPLPPAPSRPLESAVVKTQQRISTWHGTIVSAEKQRRRKAYQDL